MRCCRHAVAPHDPGSARRSARRAACRAGRRRAGRGRATRAPLRFPARLRRAPRGAHRVVVHDRRARGRRARLGLPDHVLSRRDRHRRRARRAASRRASCCSRTPPSPTSRQRRLRHDQRIARSGFGIAEAARRRHRRSSCATGAWRAAAAAARAAMSARASSDSAGFAFDLALAATQPVLLQGEAGVSRKGPRPEQTSRYYSEPQLAVRGTLAHRRPAGRGHRPRLARPRMERRATSTRGAVGWDWIGMNLDDGSALMAFRMRRADGSTLWSGGSHRAAGGATRDFADGEVRLHARPDAGPARRHRRAIRSNGASRRRSARFGVRALARRPGARQQRPAPARSTGKACR